MPNMEDRRASNDDGLSINHRNQSFQLNNPFLKHEATSADYFARSSVLSVLPSYDMTFNSQLVTWATCRWRKLSFIKRCWLSCFFLNIRTTHVGNYLCMYVCMYVFPSVCLLYVFSKTWSSPEERTRNDWFVRPLNQMKTRHESYGTSLVSGNEGYFRWDGCFCVCLECVCLCFHDIE